MNRHEHKGFQRVQMFGTLVYVAALVAIFAYMIACAMGRVP